MRAIQHCTRSLLELLSIIVHGDSLSVQKICMQTAGTLSCLKSRPMRGLSCVSYGSG